MYSVSPVFARSWLHTRFALITGVFFLGFFVFPTVAYATTVACDLDAIDVPEYEYHDRFELSNTCGFLYARADSPIEHFDEDENRYLEPAVIPFYTKKLRERGWTLTGSIPERAAPDAAPIQLRFSSAQFQSCTSDGFRSTLTITEYLEPRTSEDELGPPFDNSFEGRHLYALTKEVMDDESCERTDIPDTSSEIPPETAELPPDPQPEQPEPKSLTTPPDTTPPPASSRPSVAENTAFLDSCLANCQETHQSHMQLCREKDTPPERACIQDAIDTYNVCQTACIEELDARKGGTPPPEAQERSTFDAFVEWIERAADWVGEFFTGIANQFKLAFTFDRESKTMLLKQMLTHHMERIEQFQEFGEITRLDREIEKALAVQKRLVQMQFVQDALERCCQAEQAKQPAPSEAPEIDVTVTEGTCDQDAIEREAKERFEKIWEDIKRRAAEGGERKIGLEILDGKILDTVKKRPDWSSYIISTPACGGVRG